MHFENAWCVRMLSSKQIKNPLDIFEEKSNRSKSVQKQSEIYPDKRIHRVLDTEMRLLQAKFIKFVNIIKKSINHTNY